VKGLSKRAVVFLKIGSILLLIFASAIMVASLLNISLFFLDLKNEIPNAKISFSADYLHNNVSLKVEIPTKNAGFLPLRLSAKSEVLFSNGSVLGTAEDTKVISPGESKTMSLTAQIEGENFKKLAENPNEKIKTIFSFEVRTFFDLVSMSMSVPISLGSINESTFPTGG
jgi:archaellum component FlaF (FlaF/FlaG flagellin family)